jgi:monoamine oxidase
VVIVGAGLAGLTCARELQETFGIRSRLFEWDDQVGGRCRTLRGYFDGGQLAELHAEFISSEHTHVRGLARRYGLELEGTGAGYSGAHDTLLFNGRRKAQTELDRLWEHWGRRLFRDAATRAPFPTLHDNHPGPVARAWDRMSVPEWIERHVPDGVDGWFGRLLLQDVLDEYGGEPGDQSALNLIALLGYDASRPSGDQPRHSPLLAGSDEAYHVADGNDRLATGLLSELSPGTVATGWRLVALRDHGDGRLTCTFDGHGTTRDVGAGHVVLALPFATLRHVDLSAAALPPLKLRAIRDLGMGTNSKVALQLDRPIWRDRNATGTFYTDDGAQSGWPATNAAHPLPGIVVDYLGGRAGAEMGPRFGLASDEGPAPQALVDHTLARLEPVFPGITASWNGRSYVKWSPGDEHIGGAYSFYRVGQHVAFAGIEHVPIRTIHFAGEHTSIAFQGYMEGAVRSGERAAAEVAAAT